MKKHYILYKSINNESGEENFIIHSTDSLDDDFSLNGFTNKILKVYSSPEAVNVARRLAQDLETVISLSNNKQIIHQQ